MRNTESISDILDALDLHAEGDTARSPRSFIHSIPEGPEGDRILDALVEAAEARIMADLDRAVRTTKALIDLADVRGSGTLLARVRRVHAQALAYANRFADALSTLNDAMPRALHDPLESGRIRLTMLHVFARQSRLDDAADCGQRALADFSAAQDSILAGRAHNNLGIIERMRDRPAAAIEHFRLAESALLQQPQLLAHVRNNLGEACLDLDQFERAESAFTSALHSFRTINAHRHAGIVLGNLADLASRQGRLHQALALFEEARQILGDAAAPGDAARLVIEHAESLHTLGEYSHAADALHRALPILKAHDMHAELARANLALGKALSKLGLPDAHAALASAADAFDSLHNATGHARALAQLAELDSLAGHHDRALQRLDAARNAAADRPALSAWIDLHAAWAALRAHNHDLAARLALPAAHAAESLGVAPLAADLFHVAGLANRNLNQPATAAPLLRSAVRAADRSRRVLQAARFRSAFVGERSALWEDAAAAVLDEHTPGSTDEAFAILESIRSRALLDILAGSPTPNNASNDSSSLVAQLARASAELESLYARAQERSDQPAVRDRIRDDILAREAAAEHLAIRLESTASFAGHLASPASLPEIQAALPSHAAILQFFAEAGSFSAFFISRREAQVVRRFAPISKVLIHLHAFQFQVGRVLARGLPVGTKGDRLSAEASAELSALSELLLAPFLSSLHDTQNLAVIPTGILHSVPFPALFLPTSPSSGGGGDEKSMRRILDLPGFGIAPSASILTHLAAISPSVARGSLVIACADHAAPAADAEAHTIAASILHPDSLASAPHHLVVTGPAATRDAFLTLATGRSIIHFAGHARFIPSNPNASGLKLADGWLSATQLAALNLRGATVVLSGCDTGRSAISGGDEPLGLPRAALAAGAVSVSTTLWAVHDQAAANLMASAYAAVFSTIPNASRPSLPNALRLAQLDMASRGIHPAAWAPFISVCCPWSL